MPTVSAAKDVDQIAGRPLRFHPQITIRERSARVRS